MSRELVPPVPLRAGPRSYIALGALVAVLALGMLWVVYAFSGAQIGHELGIVEAHDAVVTERVYKPSKWSPRTRGKVQCDRAELTFSWQGNEGKFVACRGWTEFDSAVGDTLPVASVPGGAEVHVVGTKSVDFQLVSSPVVVVASLLVLGWSVHRMSLARRLVRGSLDAQPMAGRFMRTRGRHHPRGAVSLLDQPDRRIGLMPLHSTLLPGSGRCTVWATRRSLLRRRPAGPWVVQVRAPHEVFVSPGWVVPGWLRHR